MPTNWCGTMSIGGTVLLTLMVGFSMEEKKEANLNMRWKNYHKNNSTMAVNE
jgi:hypothetical protein